MWKAYVSLAAAAAAVSLTAAATTTGWDEAYLNIGRPSTSVTYTTTGPVMVLGGGAERLPHALAQPDIATAERPLILSGSAVDQHQAAGGRCDGEHVICITPEPVNTYGEALAARQLAEQHSWGRLTVITSDYHSSRARWQMERCGPDIPVSVIPAPGRPHGYEEDRRLRRMERLKLLNAAARYSCPSGR